MGELYFFTDIDQLNPQTVGYGTFTDTTSNPLYAGKDLYRVTSLHTGGATSKAYAMMDGIIAVQKNSSNANLVNLIIKPKDKLNINLEKIAYIIYKGIDITSIIDTAANKIAAETLNQLTYSLWKSRKNKNKAIDERDHLANGTTTIPAGVDSIGYDLEASTGYADTDPIEKIFNKTDSVITKVNAGWHIGNFNAAGFGIEIITEKVGYTPKLELVRNNETVIAVTTLSGSINNFQEFDHWNKKEEILNFLDPCALFGSHFKEGVYCKKLADSNFKSKTGNDLYEDVVDKFVTKNTIYLDIRNQISQSFNYLNYYGSKASNNFKITFGKGSGQLQDDKNYYSNLWPIFSFTNSDFDITTNSTNQEIIDLVLPIGLNNNPVCVLSFAYLNKNPTKFPKRETNVEEKFIELIDNTGFSQAISISIPNYNGNSNTTVKLISSYVKIRYANRISSTYPTNDLILKAEHPIDSLFCPSDFKIPAIFTQKIKLKLYDEESYLDQKKLLGLEALSTVGLASDINNNYTFFSFPKIKKDTSFPDNDVFDNMASDQSDGFDFFIDYIESKIPRVKKQIVELALSSGNILIGDWAGDRGAKDLAKTRGMYLLVLDATTYNRILSLITSNFPLANEYKVFLNLKNKTELTDTNKKTFYSYDLAITGINNVSNTAKYQTVFITDSLSGANIKVYTL